MKQTIRQVLEKKAAQIGLVGAAATLFVNNAMAALPAEATTAFSTLSGNVTDILSAVWPIVAAVVAGFTLLGLFKRGASKI